MCALPNEVPVDYFCTLDANGVRRDIAERPELNSGTVEFLASQEYMVRPPMPPSYFFALDVSHTAVNSGFLRKTVQVIRDSLDAISKKSERTQVGFVTFDSTLHFYSLKANQSQPQMMAAEVARLIRSCVVWFAGVASWNHYLFRPPRYHGSNN